MRSASRSILQSLLILALKHQDQLVLQLLHRLVDLVEPHELGLRAGQLAFELLDASGLLDDLRSLALDTLLQFSDFPAVTAVFFVEPGDHLGELICIHALSSRGESLRRDYIIFPLGRQQPILRLQVASGRAGGRWRGGGSLSLRTWREAAGVLHARSLDIVAFDVGAEAPQLGLQVLIAAVDLDDVADLADAIGCQGGDNQCHAGSDVGADHLAAAEGRWPDDDGPVWVAQDDLCTHRDQLVGKVQATFEHLVVDQHRST